MKKYKYLIKYLKEDKFKIILSIILIIIVGISNLFVGYLNGASVEAITNYELKKAIIYLGVYLLINIIFDSIIEPYSKSLLLQVENKLTKNLGFDTYIKALNLPAYAYEEKSSGEIINRITNDASSLSYTFVELLDMIVGILGAIIILFYIFYNSWIVGLEIIIFLISIYFILKHYNPKLKELNQSKKAKQDDFTSLINESIRGIREIKTLGIKKPLLKNISNINDDIYDVANKEITLSKKFNIFTRVMRTILEITVFITCTILIYYKKASLTFFVAMTYYVYRYMWLIESMNELSQTYQRVSVSLERVNEILENKLYEDVSFGNKEIKNIEGMLEFKNVTFRYPNEDITLNNFNLKIEPNKKIAIVGKSGQGKSTLFNLITRIFDPEKGEILLDGINIKELKEDELRKHISIIRQEPFIFNRSIIDNFKLLDENIKMKDIKKYIELAYLDDYIESLPNKYNTIIGEGGVNLSGGQKQRLSIARTLSKNSKIILFDEATSALDNKSQEFIKKAIDTLVINHTVIIVAHRLSTIIDADIIHVVDKGKIVASGTHNELIKKSKIYKKLYETENYTNV